MTEVGALFAAGWAWSTHARVSVSLLPAAGSMQAGLKPNSITLASSELAPNMFGASSELAPNQLV